MIIDLEEQSTTVSNTNKRKDRKRSRLRPSTSENESKENVNLRNAISYLEKYANTRDCEIETEASDYYNEESDKEQIAPKTGSGWEKGTYTNGFEEDQVKFDEKVNPEKGMYCFAFRKFETCTGRNCR